ncbi:hypothetical protein [Synechocystis salina]|uniref:Uncharacterized protein n=1 Tax=Synechocystis salina LEGE 00031 TaxID=1828736 RepID=A0ABR9VR95_9SYNC|nr:hypothetical protein [Synechocystis salina]MBE9242915.1 hypothetical protein [Synechocystis salina LEGE 00041]MBE9253859.1 hypothetical protein [Synechocystis salina LEGE 00031]
MKIDLRTELRQKIDHLSDEQLELFTKIAHFVEQKDLNDLKEYEDWTDQEWRKLALQALWDDDDVEYTLADAKEIYQR